MRLRDKEVYVPVDAFKIDAGPTDDRALGQIRQTVVVSLQGIFGVSHKTAGPLRLPARSLRLFLSLLKGIRRSLNHVTFPARPP